LFFYKNTNCLSIIAAHTWNLFSSPRNSKSFQDSLSHRILRHIHEALNIDKNKN
jgi:hypothetical protein